MQVSLFWQKLLVCSVILYHNGFLQKTVVFTLNLSFSLFRGTNYNNIDRKRKRKKELLQSEFTTL